MTLKKVYEHLENDDHTLNSWWPKIVTNLEHFQSSISAVRNDIYENFFFVTCPTGLPTTFGHKQFGQTPLLQCEIRAQSRQIGHYLERRNFKLKKLELLFSLIKQMFYWSPHNLWPIRFEHKKFGHTTLHLAQSCTSKNNGASHQVLFNFIT